MRGRRSLAVALFGVATVACGSPPGPSIGIALPRHGWSGEGPAALGSGRLELDDGCLSLRSADGTSYVVVWPPDTRIMLEDGTPVVWIGADTARVGDDVRLGGGYYSDLAYVTGELRGSVLPADCVTREVFMATGIVPPG